MEEWKLQTDSVIEKKTSERREENAVEEYKKA